MASGRLGFTAVLWFVLLLPKGAFALSNAHIAQGEPQIGLPPAEVFNLAFALAPGLAPAISGFGDDSYTDVAVDGTYRWIAHPERDVSETISAHVLILHEGEDLIASHAVFGTRRTDDLTIFRGDVSYSWGAAFTPCVQYFEITGSYDPVRLGTPDGNPDSKGWIAEMEFS